MKNLKLIALAFILISVIYYSCKTTKTTTTGTNVTGAVLTYNGSINDIFRRNCVSCHQYGGKGVFQLVSYSDVKQKIDNGSFKREVIIKKKMPPKEPLSNEDFTNLKNWLEAGAPEM